MAFAHRDNSLRKGDQWRLVMPCRSGAPYAINASPMLDHSEPIEIPLSRMKLAAMLAVAAAFVAIGLWFVIAPPDFRNQYWAARAGVAGIASIAVFGLFGIFLARKMTDHRPGLVINEKGIIDNASAFPAGEILWEEIVGIEAIEMAGQRMVLVHVRNAEQYIDRQPSAWKRKMVTMNAEMVGTPVSIPGSGLKIRFDDLLALLQARL